MYALFTWQGLQESNPRQWFWRPLYCHYTKALYFCISIFQEIFFLVQPKLSPTLEVGAAVITQEILPREKLAALIAGNPRNYALHKPFIFLIL